MYELTFISLRFSSYMNKVRFNVSFKISLLCDEQLISNF